MMRPAFSLLPILATSFIALGALWSIIILFQTQREARLERSIASFASPSAHAQWPDQQYQPLALPCFGAAQQQQTRLYKRAASAALLAGKINAHDAYLNAALDAANAALNCRPFDGKNWLNLAIIKQEQHGFSSAIEPALQLSSQLSPNEAWIAELRIPIAVTILPLTHSDSASSILETDLSAMRGAFGWRQKRLRERLGIDSLDPLELGLKK